ncbi:MAG TPA: 1-(5-phosphoribosyl)-5-[(5-phosphoribosylamino)methylideneamino]imidazole-4-carboxamide isomerase [Bacteroidales bacterium]|nr:1-(5-phosphoribosyl)-5-[(5-phosphoribosylamino)methylideneamino]imidazole-4-carboxamide isomerase [Bacteroidales bacterium]
MRIIPAIDILDGKCVRLTKGDYMSVRQYSEDPLEMAMRFEDAGCRYLHVVDLDGARSKHIVNANVIEKIASGASLKIDFGGGIKSIVDIDTAFNCGASQVTIGSVAVTNPPLFIEWLEKYGSEKIILGADFRNGLVAFNGWINESTVNIYDLINSLSAKGVTYAICTDISRDGMMSGPSVDTYRKLVKDTGINIIASGGIASIADITELEKAGCEGAIIGKVLYENRITLDEISLLC